MPAADIAKMIEAEDLARAKDLTQSILQNWDFITWDELLADDVVFSMRMATVGIDRVGDFEAIGGNLRVVGRDDVRRLLKTIYSDIKRDLRVTTEFLSGYDVVLLGKMALPFFKKGLSAKTWPVAIYMSFDDDGKIRVMTISVIDLKPLADAIRIAAETGVMKAA